MNDSIYQSKPGLFAIYDPDVQTGVVLDDGEGRYWRLERDAIFLLHLLARESGCSLARLSALARKDASDDLHLLLEAGLIESSAFPRPADTEDAGDLVTTSAEEPVHVHRLDISPPLAMILEYVCANLWLQLETTLRHWAPVRERRALKPRCVAVAQSVQRELVEQIIACMRAASIIPFVSRRCIPRALTAFDLLRRRGFSPKLLVGSYVEPFEPHIWVEWAGETLDSGHIDFSLDTFAPLHRLEL